MYPITVFNMCDSYVYYFSYKIYFYLCSCYNGVV